MEVILTAVVLLAIAGAIAIVFAWAVATGKVKASPATARQLAVILPIAAVMFIAGMLLLAK